MAIIQAAKSKSREWVLKQMLNYMPRLSMDNMETMISLGQKLLKNPEYISVADEMKEAIREGHPAIKVIEKVLYDLSPEARFRTVHNFFIQGLLAGITQREEMEKETGFKPPLFFVVSPTMRSNLNCYGCYSGQYDQNFGLPTEELDRLFSEARELGMAFITVSGGEPFLRKDLVDLFEHHPDMMFQVYTNGTLIDRDLASKLGRLDNVAPMISLEGFENRTDARRGQGHFQKMMRVMDRLSEERVLCGVSVCLTRGNHSELSSEAFADLLA